MQYSDKLKPIFCDTETAQLEGKTDGGLYGQVRLFQIYQKHWKKAIIIDCYFLSLKKILDYFHDYYFVFYNGIYDLHTINLTISKTWLPREIDDCYYLSKIHFNEESFFTFYDSLTHAGLNDVLIDSIDKKKEQKRDWSKPLSSQALTYAAADVIYLEKLYEVVKVKKFDLSYRLDIKNLKHAVDYSRRGMPTNQKTVKKFQLEYTEKLEPLLEQLKINPLSYVESKKLLDTSASDIVTLKKLIYEKNHEAKMIYDARRYIKSLQFLKKYNRSIVKGFFNPSSAITGRFSCNGGDSFDHDNLQQIPHNLYACFEAPEGYSFVYKDYSGIELRMATAFIGESTMYQMFMDGEDLHQVTAKYLNIERQEAKACNFSLLYGAGVKKFKIMLLTNSDIFKTYSETKKMHSGWFNLYNDFYEWHKTHKNIFRSQGYLDIQTALGRKIRAWRLTDSLNYPISGSTAEVQKVAIAVLYKKYPDIPLINTVHDSNTLLCKDSEAEMWGEHLDECMLEAWKYVIEDLVYPDLTMPRGYKIGKTWEF
jgi:DNA polymerase-1